MTRRNARRLLLLAFALSILIHLLGVRFVHWQYATPVETPERTTITHIVVIHRMRNTPPPNTPRPQPSARSTPKPARTTKIAVPKIANTSGAGRPAITAATVTATPPATPKPQRLPTPVPLSGCVTPNAPAAVRAAAAVPDIPVEARVAAKNGTTQVHVRLSDQGTVLDAGVALSSGSDGLDQVALQMARATQYSAALQQCKPVAGTYEFRVKFVTP